jgi:hypothetical protein
MGGLQAEVVAFQESQVSANAVPGMGATSAEKSAPYAP